MNALLRTSLWLALAALAGACGARRSGGSDPGGANCELGSEGCECYGNDTCDEGLSCASSKCVDEEGNADDDSGDPDDDSGDSDDDSDDSDDDSGDSDDDKAGDDSSNDDDSADDSSEPETSPNDDDNGQPEVNEPDTGEPDTAEPDTGEPDTGEPDTGEPDTGEPDTGEPDTGEPDTGDDDMEPEPTGPQLALIPDDGWVSESSNSAGVRGAYFTYDDGYSQIEIVQNTDYICISGFTEEVFDADWDTYFGVGLALNLNQVDDVENGWNSTSYSGVSFSVSGTFNRMNFILRDTSETEYCVEELSTGGHTIRFSTLQYECWDPSGVTPSASSLENIWRFQWSLGGATSGRTYFSACIEDLRLLE